MNEVLDHCWRRIGVYGGDQSCPMLIESLHCRNCPIFSDAARTLFDRESEVDSSDQWQRNDAIQDSHAAALVFRLGHQWLGLPPALVAEVAARQPIRRLAHRTTGKLEGVVNVRGELRLCVALGELLGLGARSEASGTARMVLV
ncbi:MAG TPA: chemotaxis protein CheW, partial [Xanthomonadaceae bacterium]|nr:chemotaxis protein CheW [Xanthomonadaceae bacterium]